MIPVTSDLSSSVKKYFVQVINKFSSSNVLGGSRVGDSTTI